MRTDKNAVLTYKKVVEIAQERNYKSAIDLGCGNGFFLNKLRASKPFESNQKINYVAGCFDSSSLAHNLDYISKLDFNNLDWSSLVANRFDLVLVLDVIEHLENPFDFVKQLTRIISNQSTILISIPNIHSYRSRIKFMLTGRPSAFFDGNFRLSQDRDFDHHVWLPALDLIAYILRCYGFRNPNIHYVYGNNLLTAHTLIIETRFR